MIERKKVFLSLPMSGRTDVEIDNNIREMVEMFDNVIIKKFNRMDSDPEHYEFVHNFTKDFDEKAAKRKNPNIYYLGEAIKKMADCDYVLFHKRSIEARGCRIEMEVAKEYDIPRIHIISDITVSMYDNFHPSGYGVIVGE